MNLLVTIVIPVYNAEKYLEECLKSVICQSYKNLEIILINDGSSDTSGEICERFASSDDRVKVIHNDNHGVSYSRNLGISIANGKKILFIDSDDTIDENFVMKMVQPLKQKNFDIVISNVNDIYVARDKVKCRKLPRNLSGIFNDDYCSLLQVPIVASPWCKLYDVGILKINNIRFEEGISFGEDFLFNISYSEYVKNYSLLREPLYNYYHRETTSLMKIRSQKNFLGALKVVSQFRIFLNKSKIKDSSKALTYMCLSYLRYFTKISDGDNTYKGFKERAEAFRRILDGMYESPNGKKTIKVFYWNLVFYEFCICYRF